MNTFVDKTRATNSLQTMKWTVQALQAVTADNNVLRLQWVCCEGPVRLHPACTQLSVLLEGNLSTAARKEMSYYVIAVKTNVAGRLVDIGSEGRAATIVSPSVNSCATSVCTINACVMRPTSRAIYSHISALLISRTREKGVFFRLLSQPGCITMPVLADCRYRFQSTAWA